MKGKIKNTAIAAAAALLMCGCDMTRKEYIEAVNECHDAGFSAVTVYNGWTNGVQDVRCGHLLEKEEE